VLGRWISRWSSLADEAALGLGTILAAAADSGMAAPDITGRARAAREKFLDGLTDGQ
jgi:toluene monooxygenase system protein E